MHIRRDTQKRRHGRSKTYLSIAHNVTERPTGGKARTKPIVFDANYEAMSRDRKTYVANSLEAMEGDFPDLELIKTLGCGSAINMPIVAGGKMLGSVNLLHEEFHYGPERVAEVEKLVVPAMACFLILRSAFTI